ARGARPAPADPDARVLGVRRPNETGVRRDLVPTRPRSLQRRSLQRRKALTQVGAHVYLSARRVRKVGVGIEPWPFVVDRRLDADAVDVGGAVARGFVITPW